MNSNGVPEMCACSDTTPEIASMDAEGMDVSAQNDFLLESALGITTDYQKYYDFSECLRGCAVAMSPEQV